MKGDLIGYRFGGTEEAHLVPILEAADPDEAQKQREYVVQHHTATEWALQSGKCAWRDHPDGRKILTGVKQPTYCDLGGYANLPEVGEHLLDELDTFCTDQIICPFCGAVIDDADYDGSDVTAECGECERTCTLYVEHYVTYTTRRPDSKSPTPPLKR